MIIRRFHPDTARSRRRRGRRRGFTLAETLAAMLILSLLSMAIATGIAFGVRQYKNSVIRSEARILCSTLTSVLREELSNTTRVSGSGADFEYVSTYISKNAAANALSKLVYTNADGDEITGDSGQLALKVRDKSGGYIVTPLLPTAAYSAQNGLTVSAEVTPVYESDGKTVSSFQVALTVYSGGDRTQLESTFYVMPLVTVTKV